MLPLYVTGMKIEDVINIESIYESGSTLALVSVPLPIWNLLPNHPACQYIGKIKTKNLCQQPSVQQLFSQIRDLATVSTTKEKPNDSLGAQPTQVPEQYLENSRSNQVKNNGASNDENQALGTENVAWPASISSSQDGEAVHVETTAVHVRNISEGILSPNEGERHEPSRKRQRELGPEMPPTPPEFVCGDPPASNKWIGLAQRLHDEGYSKNLLYGDGSFPFNFRATSQSKEYWIATEHGVGFKQKHPGFAWTSKYETQPGRVITSRENTVSMSSPYSTSESFKEIADPSSLRIVTRQGQLTETEQQRHSCYRCFINKEMCVLDAQSTQDAACSQCRKKSNTWRTWSLPCSSVGLDQRAHFLLPNIVQSQLQGASVDAYINSHVRALVPNSSIKLSLTMGFGLPLVLDAVEFVPRHQQASRMTVYGLKKANRWNVLKLESPPLLPLVLDRKLFERHLNLWLDSALQDDETDFPRTCFPGAHENWLREILDIIFQYQRSTFPDLEASGAGPYHTLRQASKLLVLNHIMFHHFCVPDGEIGSLLGHMRRYQPVVTPKVLAPRLANLILKSMLFPILKALTERVLGDLQSIFRSTSDPAWLWDPTFSIVFLCLIVVGKTQVSLVEGEAIWCESEASPYTAHQTTKDLNTMDQELSEHLMGMFHARFGTTRKGIGNRKDFNPSQKYHQGRLNEVSSLTKSIMETTNPSSEAIYSILYSDARGRLEARSLSSLGPTATSRERVAKLLARFMEPFFGEMLRGWK